MNSRERVIATLNHMIPDKIPIDFGGGVTTGISAFAYNNLNKFLKNEEITRVYDILLFLAQPSKKILDLFESDIIQIPNLKQRFSINIDRWKKMNIKGELFEVPYDFSPEIYNNGDMMIKDDKYEAKFSKYSYYFDYIKFPLENVKNKKDLNNFFKNWKIISEDEIKWLERYGCNIRNNTEYATMWFFGGSIFEMGCMLMGHVKFYENILQNKILINYFFDEILEIHLKSLKKCLNRINKNIDIILVNDDLGSNLGLQISPNIYRELIKPREKEIYQYIKNNSNCFLLLHSCGGIEEIIKDFIEIGIDALNPIQISARGMNPLYLKRKYGKYLIFYGGGIKNSTLSKGNCGEISKELMDNIKIFSKDGGYIFSTIHNIQADVSGESVFTIYNTLKNIR